MNYILLTEKKWHLPLYNKLKSINSWDKWHLINSKENFTLERIKSINPAKIFIPHWSYLIPPEIVQNFECIVFHETDLPFGRGGSPIQNLIARGHKSTKLSAIKIDTGIDTGDIYLKEDLSLSGTAEEIFIRASDVIFSSIQNIINKNIQPTPQTGEVTTFKRRSPLQSDISNLKEIEEVYDHIRMLDAEGYPHAYLEFGNFKLEFTRASLKQGDIILSDVKISRK